MNVQRGNVRQPVQPNIRSLPADQAPPCSPKQVKARNNPHSRPTDTVQASPDSLETSRRLRTIRSDFDTPHTMPPPDNKRRSQGTTDQMKEPRRSPAHPNRRRSFIDVTILGAAFIFSLTTYTLAPGREDLLNATAGFSLLAIIASVIAAYNRTSTNKSKAGLLVAYLASLFWFQWPAANRALQSQWHHDAVLTSVGAEQYGKAIVAINLFCLVLSFSYIATGGRPFLHLVNRLPRWRINLDAPIWTHAGLLACCAAFTFYIILAGGPAAVISIAGSGRSGVRPWGADGNFGTQFTPGHIISNSMIVAGTIVSSHVLILAQITAARRLLLAAIITIAASWVALSTGTRSTLVLMLAPVAVQWLQITQTSRIKIAAIACATTLAGILLSAAVRDYRQAGDSNTTSWDINEAISALDNDFYTLTAHAFAIADNYGVRTHDSVVIEMLTGPIPRAVWPDKPRGMAVVEFSWWIWGVDIDKDGGNTLPSIIGQYYLSWGWLGVVEVAIALGALLAAIDKTMHRTPGSVFAIIWSAIVVWVAVSYRSIGFGYLTNIITLIMLLFITGQISRWQTARDIVAPPSHR